jgi:hypothetical protein
VDYEPQYKVLRRYQAHVGHLSQQSVIPGLEQQELVSFNEEHGHTAFVCDRIGCERALRGFSSEIQLSSHQSQHDKPLRCYAKDCAYNEVGFATQRVLKEHKRKIHPETNLKHIPKRLRINTDTEGSSIASPASSNRLTTPRMQKWIDLNKNSSTAFPASPENAPSPSKRPRIDGDDYLASTNTSADIIDDAEFTAGKQDIMGRNAKLSSTRLKPSEAALMDTLDVPVKILSKFPGVPPTICKWDQLKRWMIQSHHIPDSMRKEMFVAQVGQLRSLGAPDQAPQTGIGMQMSPGAFQSPVPQSLGVPPLTGHPANAALRLALQNINVTPEEVQKAKHGSENFEGWADDKIRMYLVHVKQNQLIVANLSDIRLPARM